MSADKYADDAPEIDEQTTPEELLDFVRKRTQNPYVIDGTVIFNYSSHPVDEDALETAAEQKLREDIFIVPFQVTGAWSFIMTVLPEDLQEAEILIYRNHLNEYFAYKNLGRELPREMKQEFQTELAGEIRQYINN